jgi:rhodanese-related sulfurtransferase
VIDGDELAVGGFTLRVIATPGHTPEHVAYALLDGTAPQLVFTGGTLMTGGVARPDLVDPDLTVPLARDSFHSVRHLLGSLPDAVELRPTHGGGSFCSSASAGAASATTVGEQRAVHPAALASNESIFADELLASLGTFPTYFRHLRPVNQRGPKVYGVDPPTLPDLDAQDLDRYTVIDVRPIDRFSAGHIPGSISIELRDQFGTWLGWLVDSETPVVFVIDADQDQRELVRQALTIGHEAMVGIVDFGAWVASGGVPAAIELLSPAAIPDDAALVDVRQRSEWTSEHVRGAVHIELGEMVAPSHTLPAHAVVFHCGHGQRAMTAASLLRRDGNQAVSATAAGPADINEARTAQ